MNASSPRGSRIGFVVILGALIAFAPLSIDMYLPAFPAIAAHFNTTAGAVQMTLAVFFIGLSVGQGVVGPITDRVGRLPPLLIGIGLYVGASIWAALAPDIESLTAARLFQALGGCAGIVVSRAMVRDLFDERGSAQVYSLLMLVMGLAPILAPMIGGFIILHHDWHMIFWVLAAFGLACVPAVIFGLGETLPRERRQHGGLRPVLGAYLALFADRPFMGFALANAFISAAMFAYITGSPFVFIELHGLDPSGYAMLFGANAAGLIFASQVNAFLLRRISGRLILKIAMGVHLAAVVALLGFTIFMPGAFYPLAACIFVAVGCLGFVGANATAAAMARADSHIGSASALTGILQFALAAVSGGLVGAFNDGTALPMALIIAGASIAATLARLSARERVPA
ncbi:drug resistance transporter, Bcr/CflA subfamily [Parvibaculum lavamentivorans DS-1]|uniref:Bcr/CflA family efflux transporter n=1 Tax=Parvibaculum lavamentivorans (strain DS-1 / DSM 13023 / NCIMB 13966) TaxID=402881 RepID=A7HQL1_PARL1|nr:multidrug effflux MFS transporter [Parvibaculum lavamentivorans]ABS62194.1 drug resistance transporter, Bcr/CflA subfamily [Parvibaculum lavamentivorans DS-1]